MCMHVCVGGWLEKYLLDHADESGPAVAGEKNPSFDSSHQYSRSI